MIKQAQEKEIPLILPMVVQFINASEAGELHGCDEMSIIETLKEVMASGVVFTDQTYSCFLALITYPVFYNRERVSAQELGWYVDPEARGVGLGSLLLEATENWAKEKGIDSISMIALPSSKTEAFYERKGYTLQETTFIKRLS